MKVMSVEKLKLNDAIQLYDIQNVEKFNNFIVKGVSADYVSHNCGVMDEVNFQSGTKDVKMAANSMMKTYRAVKMRMKSRFISSGRPLPTMLFMMSSKKSEVDFLEQYIQEVKSEPNTYIVDEPIWKVKPKGTYCGKTFRVAVGNKYLASTICEDSITNDVYEKQGFRIIDVPTEYRPDFRKDVDGALMDIAGISSSSVMKYLSVSSINDAIIDKKNPFTAEILTIGNKDKLQIKDFFLEDLIPESDYTKPIYLHIDTSQSGDKTGLSAVCIEGARKLSRNIDEDDPEADQQQPELYYRQLFGVDIKNPSDAQIDFLKTRQFIYYLKKKGWNIKCVSTDGFQSTDTQQALQRVGINAKILSLDRTPVGYEIFKAAVNEGRVGLLNIEQMKKEAVELQRDGRTGKIDHPENGSKDLIDSCCGALWSASLTKDEYLFNYGEDLDTIIEVSKGVVDPKSQVLKEMQTMLQQDAESAKKAASETLERNIRKLSPNVTNLSPEEQQAYNQQVLKDAGEDAFIPNSLNDGIIIF